MYTITVKISANGTFYKDPNDPHNSYTGHMWYSISDGSTTNSYGFAPVVTEMDGPGEVKKTDDAYYSQTYYTGTIVIDKYQYDKLMAFGQDINLNGNPFDFSTHYNGLTNSCIDYTWKALNIIGLNPSNFEGQTWPTWNADNADEALYKYLMGNLDGWNESEPDAGDYHVIYGSNSNDTLTAETKAVVNGHDGGTDAIYGGGGDDRISGNSLNNLLVGGSGNDIVYGNAGIDTLDGGIGNDYLYGGANDDILRGGNDTVRDYLFGEADNDLIYVSGDDAAFGGTGNDFIFSSGSKMNILGGDDGYDYYLIEGTSTFINDDNHKYGSQGAVFVMVNGEYEKLTGGVRVYDASGNWTKTWKGPFGEIYTLLQTGDIEVKIGNSTITLYQQFAYNNTLDIYLSPTGPQAGLASVTGTMIVPGDNTNGAGSNGAVNSLTGGSGNDTFFVDNTGDKITEQVGGGNDTVLSSVTYTLSDNVEMLVLMGSTAINATGNALDNFLMGNSANNILNGSTGADTMIGNNGNDTYYVDNTGDRIIENTSGGIDTVVSTISWKLGENIENLTLSGTTAIDGTGNTLNNRLTGNSADNVLNGSTGADTMVGGLGNDTYYVDNASDVTTETSTLLSEIDTIITTVTRSLGTNFENLTLSGALAIDGIGNSLDNTLIGNSAANKLNGSTGADTMIGGTGWDSYYVDNAGDTVTETSTAAGEIDTVIATINNYTLTSNVNNLMLSGSSALNGYGNELNNRISGNSADNILDGSIGVDIMVGSLGNDTYYVDNVGDIVSETSTLSTEIDTVISSVSYAIKGYVENLTLTGTAINGIGNTLDNTIIGNSMNNSLSGSSGNDTLTGGDGKDVFFFNSALNGTTNVDTITDFIAVDDTIRLENAYFTNLTTIGTLAAANFVASASGAAGDTNDYILYNTTTGALYYDADGIGGTAAVQFALLGTGSHPTITNADFLVS